MTPAELIVLWRDSAARAEEWMAYNEGAAEWDYELGRTDTLLHCANALERSTQR